MENFCWGWFWKKETTNDALFLNSPSLTPLRFPEEPVAPPAPRAPRRRAKGARKKEPPKEEPPKEESEKEFDDSCSAVIELLFAFLFWWLFFRWLFFPRASLRFASLLRVARLSRVAWLEVYRWMILLMEELLH